MDGQRRTKDNEIKFQIMHYITKKICHTEEEFVETRNFSNMPL